MTKKGYSNGYKIFDIEECKKLIHIYLKGGQPKDKMKEQVIRWVAYYIKDRKKLVEYINNLK